MSKRKDEIIKLSNEIVEILKEEMNPHTKIEISIDLIKMTSVDWSEPTEEWN